MDLRKKLYDSAQTLFEIPEIVGRRKRMIDLDHRIDSETVYQTMSAVSAIVNDVSHQLMKEVSRLAADGGGSRPPPPPRGGGSGTRRHNTTLLGDFQGANICQFPVDGDDASSSASNHPDAQGQGDGGDDHGHWDGGDDHGQRNVRCRTH